MSLLFNPNCSSEVRLEFNVSTACQECREEERDTAASLGSIAYKGLCSHNAQHKNA